MGKLIYDREVDIEVVKEEMLFDMHVVTFNLKFDNRAFTALTAMDREDQRLPLKASIFIEIFPFCILFGYNSPMFILFLFFLVAEHSRCPIDKKEEEEESGSIRMDDDVFTLSSFLCFLFSSIPGRI